MTTLSDAVAASGAAISAAGASPAAGLELLGGWRASHRTDLAAHLVHHGPLPLPGRRDTGWPERFAAVVQASGLTGRGGAAFPSVTKLALVRSHRRAATVVVNAMEGEPASSKDKVMLSYAPHLVLDGAELAACALDAARIVVCVADDQPAAAAAVSRAVSERAGTGLSPVEIVLARPPGRYVTGEESALVSWLGEGPAAPTFRPVAGVALTVGRNPVLVHNAETLAHLALIARHGPAAFRAVGPADAPGTTLTTVTGAVRNPGVYEVALGTSLHDIVGRAGPTEAVTAVLTGGYGGTWVSADALRTPYAPRPMAEVGAALGPGILVVLPRSSCGIAESARIASFMAGESAGQCGPCVFGLPAVAADLVDIATGRADAGTLPRLGSRLRAVNGRGACRHPDGVVRMVRSALTVFAHHLGEHLSGNRCSLVGRPSVLPGVPGRSR